MYVGDNLLRINDEALQRFGVENPDLECDFCSLPAVEHIPVYNPADEVRDIEGAYNVISVCNTHLNDDSWHESEFFECPYCCRLFVTHHSWDYLGVNTDEGELCQKCFIDHKLQSYLLVRALAWLEQGDCHQFVRLNDIPGAELIWSGEYSGFSDFLGHTTYKSVVKAIAQAAIDKGYHPEEVRVYLLVTFTGQFHVNLAVYKAREQKKGKGD